MLLSIIIVSYNTKDLTLQTLSSVAKEINISPLLKHQTEIFVVDNNSSDDSVAAVKQFAKDEALEIHVIENKDNRGFAAANNQAIKEAQGKYILLLNSDTIVRPAALQQMIECFENSPVNDSTSVLASHSGELDRLGILSPLLLRPDETPQIQGGAFPNLGTLAAHWFMIDDLPLLNKLLPSTQQKSLPAKKQKVTQLDWVPGTAMMIRRQVIDEIGLLDEGIFMYGEDMEFCMRAKFHHWDVGVLPGAKVIHLGSASSSSANGIMGEVKGYLYIWAKHKPAWQLSLVKTIIWWGCVLRRVLFGTMVRDRDRAAVYARVMKDVLR